MDTYEPIQLDHVIDQLYHELHRSREALLPPESIYPLEHLLTVALRLSNHTLGNLPRRCPVCGVESSPL